MALFTRKTESFMLYADARRYVANGYMTVPVEKYCAERGPLWAMPEAYEAPAGGAYGWGLPTPQAGDIHNWVTSIMTGILPREGAKGLDECKSTWLAPVRVAAPGKRAARDIAELAPGALIRTDVESGDMLLLFRAAADVTDPRAYGLRQGRARCYGNDVFLAASPRHTWGERSPATVARSELPTLSWTHARDLVATIDGMLSKAAA